MQRTRPKPSRQKLWQDAMRQAGRCIQCGNELLLTKNLGARCAKKQRERMRKNTNAILRYKNSRSYQKGKKLLRRVS
jgi:hypothetical protein